MKRLTRPGVLAAPVLAATPAKVDAALDKALAAYAAERARGEFLRAVQSEAENAVRVAVAEHRDEIVAGFLASPKVQEAAKVIAEQAPTVPVATPRNPSLERTTPAVVASVAHIAASWQFLDRLVRELAPLLPGLPSDHFGPSLLLARVEYVSERQTRDIVNAIAGRKDDVSSAFASSLRGSSEEERRRDERIPAVALAHIPGVEIALPATRDEYSRRVSAFHSAIAPGKWREYVPQTHSESWVAHY